MIQLSFEDRLKLYDPLTCYFLNLGYTYEDDRDWNDINQRSRIYGNESKNRFFDLSFDRINAYTLAILADDRVTGGFILKNYIKFKKINPRYSAIKKLSHNPNGIPPDHHHRIAELIVELLKGPLNSVITGKEWIEVPYDWGNLK